MNRFLTLQMMFFMILFVKFYLCVFSDKTVKKPLKLQVKTQHFFQLAAFFPATTGFFVASVSTGFFPVFMNPFRKTRLGQVAVFRRNINMAFGLNPNSRLCCTHQKIIQVQKHSNKGVSGPKICQKDCTYGNLDKFYPTDYILSRTIRENWLNSPIMWLNSKSFRRVRNENLVSQIFIFWYSRVNLWCSTVNLTLLRRFWSNFAQILGKFDQNSSKNSRTQIQDWFSGVVFTIPAVQFKLEALKGELPQGKNLLKIGGTSKFGLKNDGILGGTGRTPVYVQGLEAYLLQMWQVVYRQRQFKYPLAISGGTTWATYLLQMWQEVCRRRQPSNGTYLSSMRQGFYWQNQVVTYYKADTPLKIENFIRKISKNFYKFFKKFFLEKFPPILFGKIFVKISSFYDPPVQNGDLVPQVVVGGSMVEVAALGQGQGSGAGDAGAGGRPATYKRLRGPGRARPTRRRRRLGRPRGRLAVYFSRSRSGLRKPPSSGAKTRKGCVTKYLIKLRAGQNKNKARARPTVHLSKTGGPPGKPEPNNKVTKLRQPLPARKLRKQKQLPKQLAQKARENSNAIKSISAYKEAGLTKICGSATGGATKTNINLKGKLYYFKVHLYHKKNKQKWFT